MKLFREKIKQGINFEFNVPKKRKRRLQGMTHDVRVDVFYHPKLEGKPNKAAEPFLKPKKIGYIDLTFNPENTAFVYIRGFYPLELVEEERSRALFKRKSSYESKSEMLPFDEYESLNPTKQRGRGLGSHVMDKLLARLKASGTNNVEIVPTNKAMARVLEKKGFTKEYDVWSKFLD